MVIKGKIIDLIDVTDSVIQIVIRFQKDGAYFPISFTGYREIIVLARQLKIEKGDVVKITYMVKSKKYQDKYFTSAIIEKISIVQKKSPQLMVDMETGEII